MVTIDLKISQGSVFKQDNDHCQNARDYDKAKNQIFPILGERGIYSSLLLQNTELQWCLQ